MTAARMAVAALSSISRGAVFGSRAAIPRGALLPGRPRGGSSGYQGKKPAVAGGEHCSGLRPACALTVVPPHLLAWLSLGGGVRSAGARVGTDALVPSAKGPGKRSGWGGVSRPLTVSSGGANVGGGDSGEASNEPATLVSDIMECTDARGLLKLVQQHGQSFESGHVGVTWGKLSEMPKNTEMGVDEGVAIQLLQVLTRAKLPEWGAPQISDVFHCMVVLHGKGRMVIDGELAGELQARVTATAGDFEPVEVGMLMFGLVTMGITPDAGLLEAMQGRATATAGDFTPPDITMLLHALVKVGAKPEPGLLEAMQGRARETAGDFSPLEVSMFMSALEQIGVTPGPGLLAAMKEGAKVEVPPKGDA
ncbi:hypothetical protein T484DRAFT_1923434 [Baffinella frigidus]|nr:hypothetical protein T484DRAFT_1923434 [Cryptophyta sp. CCMP2293]